MSLTATGLERPRLSELKADLDKSITDVLGPVNVAPDAVLGQMDGIHAAALDDAWEAIQNNYDSMYPYSAEGISLDRAVSFLGIVRLPSSPDVVTAAVYGTQGTIIPINALAHADIQYFNTSAVTITSSSAIDSVFSIPAALDSTTYSVVINGVSYVYISGVGATANSIANGIKASIGASYKASVQADKLNVSSLDGETPFSIGALSNVYLESFGSPAVFVAIASGARSLPIGALQYIDTPIYGWLGIKNLTPGAGSRDVESDIELRLRHANASRVAGSATVKAIRARLLAEVPGVTAVAIYENRTHIFVNEMPPHSFEAIVQGGVDQLVGNNIWENKPAGIETYGNLTIFVMDDNGDLQSIKFSRPVPKYLWVRVTVNLLYPEEPLSPNTIQAIKDAVTAEALSLMVGEDVITQRFIGPIYSNTTGLGMITVETALTDDPNGTPIYSTGNKAISRGEVVFVDESKVEVVGL